MAASPHIDQLAAQAREDIRVHIPPPTADAITRYVSERMHAELCGTVPDEQTGAVLLVAAGTVRELAAVFGLNQLGLANALAISGERLYNRARTSPFLKHEDLG